MLIGERFEVEREAGSGGMAVVLRARDRFSGVPVALKLLRSQSPDVAVRFVREARALEGLEHPAIVRHVAHGLTDDGRLWLAMEWLDGEDLARRLGRGRLPLAESLAVVRRAAEALSIAHARGIVHRDLKPANLFLVGGDPERLKVLDFGVARIVEPERTPTATGAMLGTPGYMAPEQARGDRQVDARADVFSLGCVLFECLTGRPAFTGLHVMAVLAKILLDDAPRASDLVEGLPATLDALVARMLSRDPERRPRDAAALLVELRALAPDSREVELRSAPPRAGISQVEQRRVLVVVCLAEAESGGRPAATTPTGALAPTEAASAADPWSADAASWASSTGARLEVLAGGAALALFSGSASATDLAVRAARGALWLRDRFPLAPVFVATGQAILDDRALVGEVIERAVVAVRALASDGTGSASEPARRPVHLDAAVATLLGDRFDVRRADAGPELWAELPEDGGSTEPLPAEPLCVGRDRELASLLAAYDSSELDRTPALCLVTGASGIGKTRLREAVCARLSARAERPRIWLARADPTEAGSALAMAGQLVRRAAGVRDADPLEVRRHRLRTYCQELLGLPEGARVAELLGEIAGIATESPSPALQLARREAAIMRDQLGRAWEDWLAAQATRGPLVLLLEDLQWSDLGTVKLVDAALAALADHPLLVLAFARAEVHERFPRLWAARPHQEVQLGPLSRRASEELARHVLGPAPGDARAASVAARAGGHPLFIAELARGVARGDDELPESVLAVLQARLESVSVEARRLLRAASVLGERFWIGAVASILGTDAPATLGPSIDECVRERFVERRRRSQARFHGEDELAFTHALVRDAVVATMTEEDLLLAHRLAADWLEERGETDALVLARHREQAGERDRAAAHFLRAGQQSLAADDLLSAEHHAERALSLGLAGDDRAQAFIVIAESRWWRREPPPTVAAADLGAQSTREGTLEWFLASELAIRGSNAAGAPADVLAWSRRVLTAVGGAADRSPEIASAAVRAAACAATGLLMIDEDVLAHEALRHAESVATAGPIDLLARAELCEARGFALRTAHRYLPARAAKLEAARLFAEGGDLRRAARAAMNAAWTALELGRHAMAIPELRAVVERELAAQREVHPTAAIVGEALRREGHPVEAEEEGLRGLRSAIERGDRMIEVLARATVALARLELGRPAEAREVLRDESPLALRTSPWGDLAIAAFLRLGLAEGRLEETAELAAATLGPAAAALDHEVHELASAEALEAAGRRAEALSVLRRLCGALLSAAEELEEPEARRRFTHGPWERARAFGLLESWESAAVGGPTAGATRKPG